MQIKVNPHTIELIKDNIVNEGEYNINTCYFEFSEEYNGLSKKAVFTNGENTYSQIISNDECIIPYEVLENEGAIIIGVYGYEISGETLIKRYSPTPVQFYVDKGSYTIAEESEQPSPTIIEQLEAQIETNANNISTLQTTKADKSEIPTKTSELINDSNFAYESDIPDVSDFITKDVDNLTNYTPTEDLSEVATTGDYEDLNNTPDLSGFITKSVNDLENYYLKSDTYTQAQVNDLISAITTMSLEVVQTLPTQDISTTTIYLVPKQTPEQSDAYDEYIYVNNNWEHIGSTEVDLTNYVQNTDYATASKAGIVKVDPNNYGISVNENGVLYARNTNYSQYQQTNNNHAISKGTLEAVITGKDLTTKSYVDGLVGDIESILETLDIGAGV